MEAVANLEFFSTVKSNKYFEEALRFFTQDSLMAKSTTETLSPDEEFTCATVTVSFNALVSGFTRTNLRRSRLIGFNVQETSSALNVG